MNTDRTDEAIRSLYRRLEPQVNTEGFCQTIGTKLAARKAGTTRSHTMRVAMVACLVTVFVAVAGVGVYEALTHLGQPQEVLVITDEPITASPASATTLTTLPAPLPESAWPYPDYTPLPEEVPSEEVRQLAELVAAHFPSLDFQVSTAIEQRTSEKTIIRFCLSPSGSDEALVTATIFMTDGVGKSEADRASGVSIPEVDIPGAESAGLVEHAQALGSAPDDFQLVAKTEYGIVVNATSSHGSRSDAGPPLDRAGLIEMVTYLVALINDGQVPLPDLSISTSTTLAWAYLPQEIANACSGIANNAFSYVAYGKEAEFQSLLVPEARDASNTAYATERERFKASGMSADDYSSLRAVVVVQWKQGAYLTDLGYFLQTRPPVPDELDAWLQQDPDVRAAAGVTMRDETVRWIRLEVQTKGVWLMVP